MYHGSGASLGRYRVSTSVGARLQSSFYVVLKNTVLCAIYHRSPIVDPSDTLSNGHIQLTHNLWCKY
jgi:hypothetical protein